VYSYLWKTHRTATERHLPYGITQRYNHRPALGLDSPTPERRKAESIQWCWLYNLTRWFNCPQTVIHERT